MHKKIKNIIAVTLIIGAFSCILPANSFIPGSIEAYASTYESASEGELSSLTITRSTGSEIELLDSYYGNEVSLSSKKDYYVELTGTDGFEISADVKGSGYVVKQFTSADKKEKGEDIGEYVKINSSSENIYLRTYESEDAYKEAYDDDDVTDCEKTYVIHVKKPAVNSEEEEDTDHAYLKSMYLSDGDIDFLKSKYSYDVNVDENVEEIIIRATPEDGNDLVEINGQSVEEDNNYEKTVSLDKGKNIIEVYVENNDDKETYTLNVYRGKPSTSTTSSTQTSTSSTTNTQNFNVQSDIKKFNAWQSVD
ncbi:hypothetical protein psyc5s11_11330 [Clostridium gelidum]|uniref:Cadherin-like beta-sandwich-like domain-containing protein n=1 Tax=Clostridium gelidum TaxID=704125 RepID=A0ABM7T2J8_9CLOT|nr:cadherin-like beta sandwich domain-containing protein [Clostridium gelidum]BCZ45066.1 hypothetical protein psyc5s11_11330 [Clostridium gelidum]